MIQTEYLNDGTLIKHFSDAGYLLLQEETGNKYLEALDTVPCRYTYIETKELPEGEELDTSSEISGEELLEMLREVL